MYFSIESVIDAKRRLEAAGQDPQAYEEITRLICPESKQTELGLMINFLDLLPSSEELVKIHARITELVTDRQASLAGITVWDIVPHERMFFCKITHATEEDILVCLHWKTVQKGRIDPTLSGQDRQGWIRDRDARPRGYRYELAYAEYHELMKQFELWLRRNYPG